MADKRPLTEAEIVAAAARPLGFFPHDADSMSDRKMQKLLRRCGYEGVGRWWHLCEMLAGIDGHLIPVAEEEDAEMLADALRFADAGAMLEWLGTLADVGLIDQGRLSDGEVWSERMWRNACYVGMQRASGRRGGRPRSRPVDG